MTDPPAFRDAVAPFLDPGEELETGAVLADGWLALTDRRWLAYARPSDRLRTVDRVRVTGVRSGTLVAAGDRVRLAPRLLVYGLLAAGGGAVLGRLGAGLAAPSVPDSAPGVGPVVSVLGLVRAGLDVAAAAGVVVGLALLSAGLGLGLVWWRSRRPAVVLETRGDDPVRVPGRAEEVAAAATELRDHVPRRPDPADLLSGPAVGE